MSVCLSLLFLSKSLNQKYPDLQNNSWTDLLFKQNSRAPSFESKSIILCTGLQKPKHQGIYNYERWVPRNGLHNLRLRFSSVTIVWPRFRLVKICKSWTNSEWTKSKGLSHKPLWIPRLPEKQIFTGSFAKSNNKSNRPSLVFWEIISGDV